MIGRLTLMAATASLIGCASAGTTGAPARAADEPSRASPVTLTRLDDRVWLHTTTVELGGAEIPSHGLVIARGERVLLVDTAWGTDETRSLLRAIESEVGRDPDAAVITHFHDDRAGGVRVLRDRGIAVWATEQTTARLSDDDRAAVAHVVATPLDSSAFAALGVEVFYPGPGHTEDNVVVWDRDRRVLFGGCLVRPGSAQDLGNTADADLSRWAASAHAVAERYATAERVIPAHGDPAGLELLAHTEALARAATAD